MARIKKCLNQDCTQFIFLDDGRTIIQPVEPGKRCAKPVGDSKAYQKQFSDANKDVTETIYSSGTLIKDPKVGKEIKL